MTDQNEKLFMLSETPNGPKLATHVSVHQNHEGQRMIEVGFGIDRDDVSRAESAMDINDCDAAKVALSDDVILAIKPQILAKAKDDMLLRHETGRLYGDKLSHLLRVIPFTDDEDPGADAAVMQVRKAIEKELQEIEDTGLNAYKEKYRTNASAISSPTTNVSPTEIYTRKNLEDALFAIQGKDTAIGSLKSMSPQDVIALSSLLDKQLRNVA